MKTIVLSDQPYAKWLADTLAMLEDRHIQKILVAGIEGSNGETAIGYYDCSISDKAVIAAHIQADSMFQTVMANADQIVQHAEEIAEEEDNTDE